jgi:hypothetical protein
MEALHFLHRLIENDWEHQSADFAPGDERSGVHALDILATLKRLPYMETLTMVSGHKKGPPNDLPQSVTRRS